MSGVRSGLMEMHVFPQSFSVVPAKVQTQQGEADVMRAQFVEACRDPVAAALAAQARSRLIVAPTTMRPPKNDKRG